MVQVYSDKNAELVESWSLPDVNSKNASADLADEVGFTKGHQDGFEFAKKKCFRRINQRNA